VNNDEALEFIRSNRRGALSTTRRDGRPALTPVVAAVDEEGRVVISTRETALKAANLRRDPWATYLAMSDAFFGQWAQIEGPAEIVSLPEAMELLVDYYRRANGEHKDWDEYRAAMERERRVLIRITVERAGPNLRG
jgi:PPOX class probable F420-dependent enzyme